MRYWKCIGNEYNQCFTIDKIYSTDNNEYKLKDDRNNEYPTQVTKMCSAKFEEVKKGENKMEDLRELIKPCYVVVRRDGSIAGVFEGKRGMRLQASMGTSFCDVMDYDKNLEKRDKEYDIMEVYGLPNYSMDISINNRELIWKREEKSPIQLEIESIELEQRKLAGRLSELRKEL